MKQYKTYEISVGMLEILEIRTRLRKRTYVEYLITNKKSTGTSKTNYPSDINLLLLGNLVAGHFDLEEPTTKFHQPKEQRKHV